MVLITLSHYKVNQIIGLNGIGKIMELSFKSVIKVLYKQKNQHFLRKE